MAMIDCIEWRGTGEGQEQHNTFLKQFIWEHLDKGKYQNWINGLYPASISRINEFKQWTGTSLRDSVAQGVRNAPKQIRKAKNRVVLFGFSQGCMVAVRLLEEIARGQHSDLRKKIVAAVLIANPLRNPGDAWDTPDAPFYGLAGTHYPYPDDIPVYEIVNPQDGITCTPGNSPLRTLSDVVDPFTLAVGGGWTMALAEKLAKGEFQLAGVQWWELLDVIQRYVNAAALMRGYLLDDQHVGNYVRWGYTERIVNHLNNRVGE